MIQRLETLNFKCLRKVSVTLSPLTVLVGPNGSGKSTFLQALDPSVPNPQLLVWQHNLSNRVGVQFEMSSDKTTNWSYLNTESPAYKSTAPTHSYQFLRLDLDRLREPNKVRKVQKLSPNGAELTNLIDSMTRKQQGDLAQELCEAIPLFQDVDVQPGPGSAGVHLLKFQDRWNSDLWYRPEEVSDGTMLTLAFLALRYQSPAPDLLAIEEPERGLHPYLLGNLGGTQDDFEKDDAPRPNQFGISSLVPDPVVPSRMYMTHADQDAQYEPEDEYSLLASTAPGEPWTHRSPFILNSPDGTDQEFGAYSADNFWFVGDGLAIHDFNDWDPPDAPNLGLVKVRLGPEDPWRAIDGTGIREEAWPEEVAAWDQWTVLLSTYAGGIYRRVVG